MSADLLPSRVTSRTWVRPASHRYPSWATVVATGAAYAPAAGPPPAPSPPIAGTVRDASRWVRKADAATIHEALEVHGYVRPTDAGFGFGEPGRRVAKKSPAVLVNPTLEVS